jgi:hypothetical protein
VIAASGLPGGKITVFDKAASVNLLEALSF